MKRYLTVIAGTLLLLAGCSKETGPSGRDGERQPIRFDVAATGAQTRAVNEIAGDADLQGESIGVFASYTGKLTYENTTVSSDFMYNQEVKYSANHVWEYDPVKYWPNDPDDYVSFFAYAPFEASPAEGSGTGIIGMSRKVDLGDPWINFRLPEDPAHQVDLLYGQCYNPATGAFTSWLDQKKAGWNDENLKFTFRHALACIGDEITLKISDALFARIQGELDVTVTGVTIVYRNLTSKARLVLRSAGEPNWKEIISGELTTSRTYDSGALNVLYAKDAVTTPAPCVVDSGHGLFYIPIRVAGTEAPAMDISLSYTVDNGLASFTDVAVATVPFTLAEAGTKQGITLTLGADLNLEAVITTLPGGIAMPGTITPEPGF